MAFGLSAASGDLALDLAAEAATKSSGPVAGPGQAAYVLALVHITAISGTGAAVTVSLQESDNGTSGWTAVTGATTAAISAAGQATCFGATSKNYVRVTATIAGTTPSVTGKVAVLAFPE